MKRRNREPRRHRARRSPTGGWSEKKRLEWAKLFGEGVWANWPKEGRRQEQRAFWLAQSLQTILFGDGKHLANMRVRLNHERRELVQEARIRRLQRQLEARRMKARGPAPHDPQWAAA